MGESSSLIGPPIRRTSEALTSRFPWQPGVEQSFVSVLRHQEGCASEPSGLFVGCNVCRAYTGSATEPRHWSSPNGYDPPGITVFDGVEVAPPPRAL